MGETDRTQSFGDTIKTLMSYRESVLIIVLIIFGVCMSIASPVFFSWLNIEAIFLALSVEATIAIGMVILLISGGLDLSIGSTLALTGVVTGLTLNAGVPVPLAILVGLIAAIGVGLTNGLWLQKWVSTRLLRR
jgi:ribose transport system permease protein